MSHYTEVIVLLRYDEQFLAPINAYFEVHDSRGYLEKSSNADTFLASINHLNIEEFRTHIENVCRGKTDAGCVQLFIMDEDADRYREVPLRLDTYPDLGMRTLERADKLCAHCNPERYK